MGDSDMSVLEVTEQKSQVFVVKTGTKVIKGLLIKRGGAWIVENIGLSMRTLLGLTAQELKDKCDSLKWKVERFDMGDTVHSLDEAMTWFLQNSGGSVLCIREDGTEKDCISYPEAESFYNGE